MTFYSAPPPARPFSEAKPTLLVAWWITTFCTCIILLRLAGRYLRVEKLFLEDKVVALSLIPLYLRIACTHIVLLYGTNNAELGDLNLSDEEINKRVIASRVVLAGRVFYAATLWTFKFTTLEFLYRLAGASRQKIYLRLIIGLRYALGASFLAVIVSDLAECQPVSHYWQVLPDPGPQCRQAYVQLLTMGVCSAVTDAFLALFPIPIILSTRITTRRKTLLVLLFCFGFVTVAITGYRIPKIMQQQGDQVVRSMWASIELLAATVVVNLVALGSFLRDSGAKKHKFKQELGSSGVVSSRQPKHAATSDWEELDQEQQKNSDSQDWDDGGPTKTESCPRSGDGARNHGTANVRAVSPTESNDSLIRSGQRASSCEHGAAEVRGHPRAPSPVALAGHVAIQRR